MKKFSKNRSWLRCLLFMSVVMTSGSWVKGQQQQDQALDLLSKSKIEMDSCNTYVLTCKNETTAGNLKFATLQKTYVKKNSDGTTWQRVEGTGTYENNIKLPSIEIIQIQNNDGIWQLYQSKKMAVKCTFMENGQKNVTLAAASILAPIKQEKDDSTYTVAEKMQGDAGIYAVTKTFSDQRYQQTVDAAKQIFLAAAPTSKLDITPKVPFLVEYDIRKSDFFLVGQVTYNKAGDSITSVAYTDAQINIPLADDLFSVPIDYKSFIAASPDDLAKITAAR